MIEGLGPMKRYGYQIIKLPHGAWFWSHLLEDVNFVPTGKRSSTESRNLRHAQNNLDGAMYVAMGAERDRIKRDEAPIA